MYNISEYTEHNNTELQKPGHYSLSLQKQVALQTRSLFKTFMHPRLLFLQFVMLDSHEKLCNNHFSITKEQQFIVFQSFIVFDPFPGLYRRLVSTLDSHLAISFHATYPLRGAASLYTRCM